MFDVKAALDHIQDDMVEQMRLWLAGFNLTNLAKQMPKMRVGESEQDNAGNGLSNDSHRSLAAGTPLAILSSGTVSSPPPERGVGSRAVCAFDH